MSGSGHRPSNRGVQPGSVVSGKRAVIEAIRSGIATDVLIAADARETQGLREVVEAADDSGIGVRRVAAAELDVMAHDHRGVVAHVSQDLAPRELSERALAARSWGEDDLVVVLDGITDPQNLGAAARSAEAAGAVVLISRIKRAADASPAAVRASAGALLHLPHVRVTNLTRTIEGLRNEGFTTVGLDGRAESDIYESPCPQGRLALVVGSEGEGISRLVREHCDLLVSLPMRGKIDSLNASASLAAALYGYVLPSRR